MDAQEIQAEDPVQTKEKRIIHFSSGEILELDDSEEEEEELSTSTPPFTGSKDKARFSFKNLAMVVGRFSLLACDFLGERLAGALGLNAAKYQYAIDRYHHDQKKRGHNITDPPTEEKVETTCLSHMQERNRYGAIRDAGGPADPEGSCVERHKAECYSNKGYQVDEHCAE